MTGLKSTVKDLAIFLLILMVCIALPLTGCQFYEHGTDPGTIAVLKGVFSTSHQRLSNNDGQWILIHYLFRFLYTHYPNLDWYGFTMIFCCALSAFLFLKIIGMVYKKQHNLLQASIMVIIFILLFENIALLEFTRMAFLLSFLGLVLILCYMKNTRNAEKGDFKLIVLGLFSFILGCLIRHQPGILSFIIILPLALIYLKRGYFSLFRLSKYLALPVLFLTASMIFTGMRWDIGYDKIPDYGGYLISLWDVHNLKNTVVLKSKEDSLVYHVVADLHFVNDPAHINPQFFEKIGVPYTDKKIQSLPTILSNRLDYERKFKEQSLFYVNEHIGWALLLCGIALLALFTRVNEKIRIQRSVGILFLIYTSLYFLISIFLKMEERIFCPMALSFSVVFALLIEPDNRSTLKQKSIRFIWFLLLLYFAGVEFSSFHELFNRRKNEVNYVTGIFKYLSARNEKYIFVDQITDQIYLSPLQKDPLRSDKYYPTIDNFCFFLCPTYPQKMEMITGGKETKGYLQFLGSHTDECLVVSDSGRLKDLLCYFNYMYHLNLKFQPIVEDFRENYVGNKNDLPALGIFKITL